MLKQLKSWLRTASQPAGRSAAKGHSKGAEEQRVNAVPVADNPAAVAAVEERDRRFAEGLAKLSSTGRLDWPPQYDDPFPELKRALPEIQAADLNIEVLGGAVAHHGALIIRGLFTPEQVASTREMQDKVKSISLSEEPDRSGWYMPFDGKSPRQAGLRARAESRGGNWLVDSPLGLELALNYIEGAGVVSLVSEHFGERPAISMQKCTLRSVEPKPRNAGWHQDGSFLGDEVRTMNLWVALSECGGSVPATGIEIIPTRFEEILPVEPELGVASLSFELVDQLIKKHSLVLPHFAPGDGIMFDEKLLHRTACGEHHTQIRYALECWFFAPSHASPTYAPLLV
jgi:hypothetical protein